jgi:hypothetical protein
MSSDARSCLDSVCGSIRRRFVGVGGEERSQGIVQKSQSWNHQRLVNRFDHLSIRGSRSIDSIFDMMLDFTGISAPYEAPINPEVHIKTDETDIAEGVQILIDYLTAQKLI